MTVVGLFGFSVVPSKITPSGENARESTVSQFTALLSVGPAFGCNEYTSIPPSYAAPKTSAPGDRAIVRGSLSNAKLRRIFALGPVRSYKVTLWLELSTARMLPSSRIAAETGRLDILSSRPTLISFCERFKTKIRLERRASRYVPFGENSNRNVSPPGNAAADDEAEHISWISVTFGRRTASKSSRRPSSLKRRISVGRVSSSSPSSGIFVMPHRASWCAYNRAFREAWCHCELIRVRESKVFGSAV